MTYQEEPKISIITACYNSEKTIEQTIQSVIEQTYQKIEYIIVDGASTDGTMDIVRKYEKDIDIVISEPDKGVYDAFNKGVSVASGEYILFLNSDDFFYTNSIIEEASNYLVSKGKPIGIYGDIYEENQITGHIKIKGTKKTLKDLQNGKMPPHPGVILAKRVIEEFQGFNLAYRIAADFELLIKVFLKYEHNMYYFPKVFTVFRLGGLSSALENKSQLRKEYFEIITKYFNETTYSPAVDILNENYMRIWLENLIFQNNSISNYLVKKGFKNVAVFGSGDMSLLISRDIENHGMKVLCYLDNDCHRHGIVMNNISVESPSWLIDNKDNIDAVILGFQGYHDEDVKKQLQLLLNDVEFPIISWRDLVNKIR